MKAKKLLVKLKNVFYKIIRLPEVLMKQILQLIIIYAKLLQNIHNWKQIEVIDFFSLNQFTLGSKYWNSVYKNGIFFNGIRLDRKTAIYPKIVYRESQR